MTADIGIRVGRVGPQPKVCACAPGEESPVAALVEGARTIVCVECLQPLPPYNDSQEAGRG